jgi:phosphodiesterase/alkaline phosphatase D-like protein
MIGRLIEYGLIVTAVLVVICVAVYRATNSPEAIRARAERKRLAAAEMESSARSLDKDDTEPSFWFFTHHAVGETKMWVGMTRIRLKDQRIMEKVRFALLDTTSPTFAEDFDKAYDEAYKATTNANTALSRR